MAIVGAGLAGLTAAYELSKEGLRPVVYEGSTRLGGRCYSIKFPDGQIAEHGGEFINTTSQDAIKYLAKELLGDNCLLDYVGHENLGYQCWLDREFKRAKATDELWWFDGEVYTRTQADNGFTSSSSRVFGNSLTTSAATNCCHKDPMSSLRELDWMSLADWVEKHVRGGRASKLGQLIENALSEECAANSTALSGLLPAQQFWKNTEYEFRLYDGVSDEAWHLRGGNDQIPSLLNKKLEMLNRGSDGDGAGRRYLYARMERCG